MSSPLAPISSMSRLFSPLRLRSIEFPHRVFVSPMCQYSSENGLPNDWHFVHLGSRAVGGAALVCVEASGVTPEGRITLGDAGIWSEEHARAWQRVVGSGGAIKLRYEAGLEQRTRLEMEGVKFRGTRVDMVEHQYRFRTWEFDE